MGLIPPFNLQTWLEPVIAQMVEIRQLGEYAQEPQTKAILEGCASLAYSQICAFTCREYHRRPSKLYILEEHPNGTDGDVLRLRNSPVYDVAKIMVISGPIPEEVDSSSYYITANRVCGVASRYPVHIWYSGGYLNLEESPRLIDIFTHQALANYHRRDIIGISSITNGSPSSSSLSVNSDSGGLLKTTKASLEKDIYLGEATLLAEGIVL